MEWLNGAVPPELKYDAFSKVHCSEVALSFRVRGDNLVQIFCNPWMTVHTYAAPIFYLGSEAASD